jgi:hypothetical protein
VERDEHGRPAAWVTEVEAEFDANERDSWYALAEWREAICPDCGNLRAICSNPAGLDGDGFYPQRDICFVKRAQLAAQRAFEHLHEKEKPTAGSGWLTDADGSTIWASPLDLSPDDDFLPAPESPLEQLARAAHAADQVQRAPDQADQGERQRQAPDDGHV